MPRRPSLYTIAPTRPFVDVLAAGLLAAYGTDPLRLADVTVLLPTRRAGRLLREAFLRQGGGRALLLPRMMPLGDVDEDDLSLSDGAAPGEGVEDLPPAIPGLRRQLLLAQLIQARPLRPDGTRPTPEIAARLARDLAGLMDRVQTERLSFDRLTELVPDRYAEHWRTTVEFLSIVTDVWPSLLEAEGMMDPADRRDRLMTAQAEAWRHSPPDSPVIAAGSTGSIPATADLMAVVAGLPQGAVVLPGLDRTMDADSWAALDWTHPQFGLRRLLERLGVEREAVADWPDAIPATDTATAPADRARLLTEAMRPAPTAHAWHGAPALPAATLDGVTRITCPGPREEAETIALMMRETLETPGRTAALVTFDRTLARRVAAALGRWGLTVDDSAGQPLALTPPGTVLRLLAAAAASDLAPGPLLDLLRHPLVTAGRDAGLFRRQVRRFECAVLRGPRHAGGFEGLRRAAFKAEFAEDSGPLRLIARLEGCMGAFLAGMQGPEVPLTALVKAHMEAAEALAETDTEPGPLRLWAGPAGEAAATFAAELADAADGLPPMAPRHYPGVLDALLAGHVVRTPPGMGHPRLAILGPLEARVWHADRMILGGLNEGSWPPAVEADPWMSRPMQAAFGLPPPEQRIGLSAHDFTQALGAPEVALTRAARVEGTPTVPSRWLLRLDAVTAATGLGDAWAAAAHGPWLAWTGHLRAVTPTEPVPPPAPTPPVEARPTRLSVTRIETWRRDPYGIYARYVLGLEKLADLDQPLDMRDFGMLVHAALEGFRVRWPGPLPPDPERELLAIGEEEFGETLADAHAAAFWWPRFERTAAWIVAQEQRRADTLDRVSVECSGRMTLSGTDRPFTLTGTADRIERRTDGTLVLVDHKTGIPPSKTEVSAGYAPQLPLEAAMVAAGAFADLPAAPVSGLEYWRLKGNRDAPGEIRSVADDPTTLAAEALAGLTALVNLYARPETPYPARPVPDKAPRYSDYEHLARVAEWATAVDEEGGG
ncbi:double-strand break repair protein AddB [Roseospira marina]|uniref:Double-strand break repair protein AddB n=1 Tax=Roseospira marina TaxID=140057 RepID=A0A5M6IFT8_9PROT|nr:double-strand break repair protein AddB [Roseospira marina]KAA5607123.1 double-strand break repair protein AddB [Roseospira marina]MBB4312680.1 ATP-dependent helicase/nuclease subunit B [Roseospira marina]MBB5086547.1 ATP-dependent helicase/nuclease subunit B [Roseospira marina]